MSIKRELMAYIEDRLQMARISCHNVDGTISSLALQDNCIVVWVIDGSSNRQRRFTVIVRESNI